jgi:hypothetical protein
VANFGGRLALHDQKPEAVAVIKLATSPLVLTTFALRACDAGRPLTGIRAAPYCFWRNSAKCIE